MSREFIVALGLTTIAGLSTGIGGLIVVMLRRFDERMLSAALGFSAGIMLTVSLSDMLPHAGATFVAAYGRFWGALCVVGSIVIGIALAVFADAMVPDHLGASAREGGGLHRLGIVTAIAVCIHNFPEGIATFMSSYADLSLGLPLTLSVALHNIPEGMAVAMPIFYATHSRKRAMYYALLSGLSEPLGAVLTYLLLRPFMNDIMLAVMFGVIVGLMCTIAFDELVPSSLSYNYPSVSLAGVLLGILVMSGSIFAMA